MRVQGVPSGFEVVVKKARRSVPHWGRASAPGDSPSSPCPGSRHMDHGCGRGRGGVRGLQQLRVHHGSERNCCTRLLPVRDALLYVGANIVELALEELSIEAGPIPDLAKHQTHTSPHQQTKRMDHYNQSTASQTPHPQSPTPYPKLEENCRADKLKWISGEQTLPLRFVKSESFWVESGSSPCVHNLSLNWSAMSC